jgi:hypothetical protein
MSADESSAVGIERAKTLGSPLSAAGEREGTAARLVGWGLLSGLGAVALYVGWWSRSWPLIHDAPLMHYIAWRIDHGAVPYRDVFDMNFPGVYLLHLLVLKTLGAGDVAWRAFDLGWLGVTALAIAALAAPWGRLAAAGGALFFVAYHIGGGAWQAGQRDFLLCPFLLAGALGIARWGEHDDRRALLLAGLALGAVVMIKPHALVLVLALSVLVVVRARSAGARWRALATLAGGLVVVPVAIVWWLAAVGALGPWRDIVWGYLIPLYSRLGRAPWSTVYRWPLWPAIAAALLVSVSHVLAARRVTFRHGVALIGIAYGVLHFFSQKFWEYQLYPLAAFAAVLLFSETAAVLRARTFRFAAPLLASLTTLIVLLAHTSEVAGHVSWAGDRERTVSSLVRDLDERRRQGDTVQILDTTSGGAHALLRLGLVQPTRFLYDFHFFHDIDRPFIQALRAELVDGLALSPPRFIVLFRHGWPSGQEERIHRFPELARLLAERYVIAVERGQYLLYAKRDGS